MHSMPAWRMLTSVVLCGSLPTVLAVKTQHTHLCLLVLLRVWRVVTVPRHFCGVQHNEAPAMAQAEGSRVWEPERK